jgi:hypothetical protein
VLHFKLQFADELEDIPSYIAREDQGAALRASTAILATINRFTDVLIVRNIQYSARRRFKITTS